MKMVISQLEGILIELKDVAKELREVRFKVGLYTYRYIKQGFGGHLRGKRGEGDGNRGRTLLPAGSASPLGYI